MEALLPHLVGPAGTVFALSLVLFAIYKLIVDKLIPVGEKAITRHLDQVDRLIEAHDNDRAAWVSQMSRVQDEMSGISREMAGIAKRCPSLQESRQSA